MSASIASARRLSECLSASSFLTRILPSVHSAQHRGRQLSRRREMSTISPSREEPLPLGAMLNGSSGKIYKIQELISDRRKPLLCVYRARADKQDYIVKNMIPGEFEYQLNLQKPLSSCPNVRAVIDTIPELELFIYQFLAGDLLQFSQKPLSRETRLDIKPNNILVDYEENTKGQVSVTEIQISDLEDTVIVPPGKWLRGPLCGNAMWRSPESWCRSRQNQASDVFSFGIVMIYVMTNKMIFRVSDDQLKAADSWRYVLARHISYFADEEGLNGFLEHIGKDNPLYENLVALASTFTAENPRHSFGSWDFVEPDLRDLVGKMTNLDPTRRINAKEALAHRWFNRDV